MAVREFTPELATRTLPLVSRIVDDIRRVYRELEHSRKAIEAADAGGIEGDPRDRLQDAFDHSAGELTELARELEPVGCVLKDPAQGLVDFPSTLDGETVWLCWQPGEREVAYWHPFDSGFSARRPLPAHAAN